MMQNSPSGPSFFGASIRPGKRKSPSSVRARPLLTPRSDGGQIRPLCRTLLLETTCRLSRICLALNAAPPTAAPYDLDAHLHPLPHPPPSLALLFLPRPVSRWVPRPELVVELCWKDSQLPQSAPGRDHGPHERSCRARGRSGRERGSTAETRRGGRYLGKNDIGVTVHRRTRQGEGALYYLVVVIHLVHFSDRSLRPPPSLQMKCLVFTARHEGNSPTLESQRPSSPDSFGSLDCSHVQRASSTHASPLECP